MIAGTGKLSSSTVTKTNVFTESKLIRLPESDPLTPALSISTYLLNPETDRKQKKTPFITFSLIENGRAAVS